MSLISIGLLIWWSWHSKKIGQHVEPPSQTAEQATNKKIQAPQRANQISPEKQQTELPNRLANAAPSVTAADWQYYQNNKADPLYDWKQPINFYGMVLDENDQPVTGASADFKWTDLSPDGTSEYHTTSDSLGFFSMLNQKGKRLSVSVSKSGYYSAADARLASFEYANPADGLFTPDPNSPVPFHLRKKGEAAQLIHGLKLFGSRVDGTLSYVDLTAAKNGLTPPGDLTVKCNRSGRMENGKFDWVFTVSVPAGGLIESTDEFMFLAPEEGYQSSFEVGHKATDSDWVGQEKRKFYLKSRGHYARVELTMIPNYNENAAYDLEWFLNTNGSRNLESNPAQLINVK